MERLRQLSLRKGNGTSSGPVMFEYAVTASLFASPSKSDLQNQQNLAKTPEPTEEAASSQGLFKTSLPESKERTETDQKHLYVSAKHKSTTNSAGLEGDRALTPPPLYRQGNAKMYLLNAQIARRLAQFDLSVLRVVKKFWDTVSPITL